MNQKPSMHQLPVLFTGWAVFFHWAPNGVHTVHFFLLLTTVFLFYFIFCSWPFSFGLDLTHSYSTHLPIFISIAPTLTPYLLSLTDIVTLMTNYPIDLATIQTTYPTNLATLLITYLINLTIVLTIYPTNLATLHTQPSY